MERFPVIIPARSGSKGIIGKNIIDFCGKPLLAWSILQAKESERVSDVYVSTDGDNIAQIAKQYGAKVIERPPSTATDTASSEAAIMHAVTEIEKSSGSNIYIFLQATSPIRRKGDISSAVKTFLEGQYDSLFSMAILEDYCLWKYKNNELSSFTYDYRNRGRRQDRDALYLENGSIYIFKKEILLHYQNRLGGKIGMYEMPVECSYEIDAQKDIPLCEYFMNRIQDENGR